jgi:hypothetical protein
MGYSLPYGFGGVGVTQFGNYTHGDMSATIGSYAPGTVVTNAAISNTVASGNVNSDAVMLVFALLPATTTCDSYYNDVQLLAHFDGTNGSTTFTDSSQNNATLTPHTNVGGGPVLTTGTVQFGTASLSTQIPVSTSVSGLGYLSSPTLSALPALNIDTGDWTLEGWFNVANPSSFVCDLMGVGAPGQNAGIGLGFGNTFGGPYLYFNWYDNAASTWRQLNFADVGPLAATGTWGHAAFVRHGTTITAYLNGVGVTSSNALTGSLGLAAYLSSAFVSVGTNPTATGGGLTNCHNGWIDDFRLTVGLARYTANFVPPSAAFGGLCTNTVPNVTGSSLTAAIAAIIAGGFTIGTITGACSNTVPANSVISYSPTMAAYGAPISIVASTGPCTATSYLTPVFVPATTGKAIMVANPGNINPRVYPPERDTTVRAQNPRFLT